MHLHRKLKFSIGTDVARSSLCPGRPRFASQIASVATPGAHQVVAGILLLHQVGPTRHLMMSKVSKTYDCPQTIHPANYSHSVRPPGCSPDASRASISAIQRPTNAHSIYVYSDLSHIMLWVAGGNCATKMCNRIRGERYRGTRLVTLPYLTLPYINSCIHIHHYYH